MIYYYIASFSNIIRILFTFNIVLQGIIILYSNNIINVSRFTFTPINNIDKLYGLF